jgi:ATP-dependent Clp protease ATP-binding subunit ClpC
MFGRLTNNAQIAFARANHAAQRLNHQYIGTEHILLGLVEQRTSAACKVLQTLNIDPRRVKLEVEKLVPRGSEAGALGVPPQTPRAKNVLEHANQASRQFDHRYIGTQHLLLGLLRENDGIAAQVLANLGLTAEGVTQEMLRIVEDFGELADDSGALSDPFQLPTKISLEIVPGDPRMAVLKNEEGHRISPPLRFELAQEIVNRFNAH